MMSADEYASLCPGDVVLTLSNENLSGDFSGVHQVLITGWNRVNDYAYYALGLVLEGTNAGTYIGRGRHYAGKYEVAWYRHELDSVISRGTEFYRTKQ